VNLTKDLERRGLVTRAPSPADERVVVIALTAEGQMLLSEADAAARRFDERISALIGDLGPEVAAGLTRILNADRLADPDQRSGT